MNNRFPIAGIFFGLLAWLALGLAFLIPVSPPVPPGGSEPLPLRSEAPLTVIVTAFLALGASLGSLWGLRAKSSRNEQRLWPLAGLCALLASIRLIQAALLFSG